MPSEHNMRAEAVICHGLQKIVVSMSTRRDAALPSALLFRTGHRDGAGHENRTRRPSRAMPYGVVLQVSLGLIGKARVRVPVVTISPASSGPLKGSCANRLTRYRSADRGPSSTLA